MQFGPGFVPTFLYYFTSTAVVFALVASRSIGISLETGLPQQLGAAGGLIAGLLGAYFNRTVTLSIPTEDQKAFLAKLHNTLAQMGYQQTEALEDDVLVYERSSLSKFLSGKVFVQVDQESVAIASRSIHINAIRKRM